MFLIFGFFFLGSCSNVSFLYNESKNITNPLYGKVFVEISGKEISTLSQYIGKYFGSSNLPEFSLEIKISEEKKKISVQNNQAVSKQDHKLQFEYILKNKISACEIYKKTIISRFSYTPKSSGYNFGSDQSLEKMYELSASNNLQQFISILSDLDFSVCK